MSFSAKSVVTSYSSNRKLIQRLSSKSHGSVRGSQKGTRHSSHFRVRISSSLLTSDELLFYFSHFLYFVSMPRMPFLLLSLSKMFPSHHILNEIPLDKHPPCSLSVCNGSRSLHKPCTKLGLVTGIIIFLTHLPYIHQAYVIFYNELEVP